MGPPDPAQSEKVQASRRNRAAEYVQALSEAGRGNSCGDLRGSGLPSAPLDELSTENAVCKWLKLLLRRWTYHSEGKTNNHTAILASGKLTSTFGIGCHPDQASFGGD